MLIQIMFCFAIRVQNMLSQKKLHPVTEHHNIFNHKSCARYYFELGYINQQLLFNYFYLATITLVKSKIHYSRPLQELRIIETIKLTNLNKLRIIESISRQNATFQI